MHFLSVVCLTITRNLPYFSLVKIILYPAKTAMHCYALLKFNITPGQVVIDNVAWEVVDMHSLSE